MRYFLITATFLLVCSSAWGQEIFLLGGYGLESNPTRKAGAWQLEYLHGLGEHAAVSLSYLNQGHFPEHHRDGHSASLWLRTNPIDRRFSLAAGAGAVYYYDTTHPPPGTPSQDVHGWASIFSLAATWYTESRWLLQFQTNWIRAYNSFDTLSGLIGIGYQLDPPETPGPIKAAPLKKRATDNEITVLGGETVVNIPGNGRSNAIELEYRRGIWRYLEWTAAGLYEGKSDLIQRYGLASQLWLARPFLEDRVALSAGGGVYAAKDERREPALGRSNDIFVTPIVTLSGSIRLDERWHLRILWHRVITRYDRDSDVFLAGLGYRF